jgi:hypothetical protein
MLFRAEGRENIIADRACSPGLLASTDRRESLFYFAAAVPAVGFVHGPALLERLDCGRWLMLILPKDLPSPSVIR